jgi:mutator protein MutT
LNKKIKVAAAIIVDQGKLLIAQRLNKGHLAGYWEFPGGKVHEGETWPQCLVRELQEELQIQIEVGKSVWQATHVDPQRTIELNFFSCRWISGEPKAIECQDFKWVAPEELVHFQFPPADEALIQKLIHKEIL